jgi:plasmid maintenance system antidote protein VapI
MSTCFADILTALRAHPLGLTSRELAEVMHITPLTASGRLA